LDQVAQLYLQLPKASARTRRLSSSWISHTQDTAEIATNIDGLGRRRAVGIEPYPHPFPYRAEKKTKSSAQVLFFFSKKEEESKRRKETAAKLQTLLIIINTHIME
jgi:hypothetical protein